MKLSVKDGDRVLEATIERENGYYAVEVEGRRRLIDAHKLEGDFYSMLCDQRSYEISIESQRDRYLVRHGAAERVVTLSDPGRRARDAFDADGGESSITTQMPGKVVRILVQAGDDVVAGQGVIVVEAMKMENEIGAPRDGRVKSIETETGQTVEGGAVLVRLE